VATAEAPVHHLNCGTLCPRGGRLLGGQGGPLAEARIVCHCLAIEAAGGLVLVDTGLGTGDNADPSRLGQPFRALLRPRLRREDTARAGLEALGFSVDDVRHVVLTHLDFDHAGGLSDFPQAEVHVFAAEHEAAMRPGLRERSRYVAAHWAHGPRWRTHGAGGEDWRGFESIRILPGADPEVLLIPLIGHSRGHTGVAVRREHGWLLHCGDAYFHHGQVEVPSRCPPLLRAFQELTQADRSARLRNEGRLRELARRSGGEVELICSHDPAELDRHQGV
jgi:glyoxylase-like metal-dependent hydrolase (beta-lactamase superfamily II)